MTARAPKDWRCDVRRYGCDRSRRALEKHPHKADRLARLTIEGGLQVRAGKVVRHG